MKGPTVCRRHGRRDSLRLPLLLAGILSAAVASANTDRLATVSRPQPGLLFEENRGQFHESVDFAAHGRGYAVFLSQAPVVELFRYADEPAPRRADPDRRPGPGVALESTAQFRLRVLGANAAARARPLQKSEALTHYLMGGRSEWRKDVPNFERVRYEDILPQVDVEYYGRGGRLEYDFVIRPGGEPGAIKLMFDGVDGVRLDENGDLVIGVDGREFVQRAPHSYQVDADGRRQVVASDYTLENDVVGFRLAAWDTARPLVIDPVLEYSTYFGGARSEEAYEVALDASGNIYVIGTSTSSGLGTPGVYLSAISGAHVEEVDTFLCSECTDNTTGGIEPVSRVRIIRTTNLLVTKFTPDGQTVLWSTYFNGSPGQNVDLGIDSADVSDAGEVAFGLTEAGDGLPLINETQSWSQEQDNAYVAKLNSAGNGLVFGTYLNLGDSAPWLRGLAVSAAGEVAVTGRLTVNNTFPVVGGIPGQSCTMNTAQDELRDGYMALFDASGVLTFSSCLGGDVRGGSSFEGLRGVTFGLADDLYVLGYSSMLDFPVVNPVQGTINVPTHREMTISRIDPDSGSLLFSTYFGPTTASVPPSYGEGYGGVGFLQFYPYGIEVDSGGNIVVSGFINSLSYPLVNPVKTNLGAPEDPLQFVADGLGFGAADIFVTKLHPDNGVVFSTYLGGSQYDGLAPAIALDGDDNIYVSTATRSDDYPILNPVQASKTGDTSLAVSKLTPDGALAFSTYLGGSNDDHERLAGGLAVNAAGKIIVAGRSKSLDFPIVGSGTSNAGGLDITLAIIDQSGDVDTDGDGVPDAADSFPEDVAEWRDTDGDSIGDRADADDDGDGVPDLSDRFPQDAGEQADADEDGAGDNLDQFDADSTNYFDFDADGTPDFADSDIDDDGVVNYLDEFDYDAGESADTDEDGVGNNADEDDDGDGFADAQDLDPLDPQIPAHSYEGYDPLEIQVYLSPWPDGYDEVVGADAAWTSATNEARSGQTSLGSRTIGHDQVSAIQYSDTFAGGALKFWYKVDSQSDFDMFTFSVDGNVALTASGDSGWQQFESTVPAGVRTLEWRYTKDGSVSQGADAVWVDDLVFDTDGDFATDDVDNCILIANPLQRDTDADGYGNYCDADFNNDCIVNAVDLGLFKLDYLTSAPDVDLNGDGIVNVVDLGLFKLRYLEAPGPGAEGLCGAP